MWPLIDSLTNMPVAVLRGANSDLLSAATVQRMAAVLPGLLADDVPDRGHVPFLDEPVSKTLLSSWLAAVDAKEKGRSPGP
jgi:pimeloyl-ACP methyl ester carboxylesterase